MVLDEVEKVGVEGGRVGGVRRVGVVKEQRREVGIEFWNHGTRGG